MSVQENVEAKSHYLLYWFVQASKNWQYHCTHLETPFQPLHRFKNWLHSTFGILSALRRQAPFDELNALLLHTELQWSGRCFFSSRHSRPHWDWLESSRIWLTPSWRLLSLCASWQTNVLFSTILQTSPASLAHTFVSFPLFAVQESPQWGLIIILDLNGILLYRSPGFARLQGSWSKRALFFTARVDDSHMPSFHCWARRGSPIPPGMRRGPHCQIETPSSYARW